MKKKKRRWNQQRKVVVTGTGRTVMPFGKYKGRVFQSIPQDYLEWMLDSCRLCRPDWKEEIRSILQTWELMR